MGSILYVSRAIGIIVFAISLFIFILFYRLSSCGMLKLIVTNFGFVTVAMCRAPIDCTKRHFKYKSLYFCVYLFEWS